MAKYTISENTRYQIPSDIDIIEYNNKYLVVAPRSARWLVLETTKQISVLKYFMEGHSIKDALDNTEFFNEDVSTVVTQIEARRLCGTTSRSITEDKRSLHLYLTNRCNLSCPHCYMFSGHENENELTTAEILNLINDYVKIAAGHRITISGGEPSIHPDFELIVKTAAESGLEVNVLTNGSLMSKKRIETLSKYISSIQISIDGFSEESNAIIRGKGHFDKALSAVDSFVENGIETSIAITPTLDMLKSYQNEYVDFAKKLAMKYAGKNFRVKFAEGLSDGRSVKPTDISNQEYADIVRTINNTIYGEDFELISFVEKMRNNVIVDNCMFGVFAITSNGDVYFCPEIGKLPLIANVRTSSFEDIYIKSRAAENATSISNLHPCSKCCIRNICGGGCRIKEFPDLTNRTSFESINYEEIKPRECNQAVKEKFYNLMIKSNEYLFVPLISES